MLVIHADKRRASVINVVFVLFQKRDLLRDF